MMKVLFENQKLLLELFKSNYNILEASLSILKFEVRNCFMLIVANNKLRNFGFPCTYPWKHLEITSNL